MVVLVVVVLLVMSGIVFTRPVAGTASVTKTDCPAHQPLLTFAFLCENEATEEVEPRLVSWLVHEEAEIDAHEKFSLHFVKF